VINWFQRQKLIRKGLACDKTRRQRDEVEILSWLEKDGLVRLGLLSTFAVLLNVISFWGVDLLGDEIHLLILIVFLSAVLVLQLEHTGLWNSNSRILLTCGCIWINLFFIKGLYLWIQRFPDLQFSHLLFLAPTSLACLLLTPLLGPSVGLFAAVYVSLLGALLLGQSFPFLLVSLITGFTSVYCARRVRHRNDLLRAGLAGGAASLLCALAFGLIHSSEISVLLEKPLIGLGVGIFSAVLINALLPLVETTFGLITDISWLELGDLNHPLLRQLTIEAPGTYHHSLVVASLADAAASSIGANAQQCRVLSYFHDIGKIIKPEYFTENMPPDENVHDNLSPSMSALIIIAHVKEGIDLALKYRLKRPILDAIQQHHGTTLVYYFYKKAKQQQADAKAGGQIMRIREEDIPDVSENSFRYVGPKPQTKEIGLLMLADAIESASRSLQRPTPQKIENLVDEIIQGKIKDHQLDESHLTLNEIQQAAESFVFTLKGMHHGRVSYPKHEPEPDHVAPVQSPKKGSVPPSSAQAAA
jgi:putative nucleotidyltransferase with HDIG domain